MNCTLVELACTMLTAAELLEFLWEPTVVHAVYLRNLLHMKPRAKAIPYQLWNG